MRRRLTSLAALAGLLALLVTTASAAAQPIVRFDALDTGTLGRLQPFTGSDGRQHLVYELKLRNVSAELAVVVTAVQVRDARTDRTIATITGDELTRNMDLGDPFARVNTTTIGPAQTAVLWTELRFDALADVPARLRFVIGLTPAPGADLAAFAARYNTTVTTDAYPVDRARPPVFQPHLRGAGFVAFNGCCKSPGHALTALGVEGHQRVAERFAIDWMQADRNGQLWTGDGTRNEEYFVYDEPIYAGRAGRVVAAVDRYPDTPAQARSTDTVSPVTAAGNHVIVDYGKAGYGLFAHIRPRTVAVEVGQRVKANTVLGHVGSSGNSDAPHLHFHMMSRPSPLAADGRPYEYASFALTGQVVDDEIAWRPSPRNRADELPLDFAIVDFP